MNAQTIRALAWQIRSDALLLVGDRVELFSNSFLSGPNKPTCATVQARADAINTYITANGLHFESLAELQKHFDNLEATQDEPQP